MARFEVHIPSTTTDGFNITFRLDAEHWMAALKQGLARLGEQGTSGRNLLVDLLPDESIDVTDTESGRVFRIRELHDPASTATAPEGHEGPDVQEAQTERIPAVEPFSAGVEPTSTSPSEAPTLEMPAIATEGPHSASRAEESRAPILLEQPLATEASPLAEASGVVTPEPTSPVPHRPAVRLPAIRGDESPSHVGPLPSRPARLLEPIRPEKPIANEPLTSPSQPITGRIGRPGPRTRQIELLSELFERTQEIFDISDERRVLGFLLDLALEKIPCESGSIFVAELGSTALELAVARGPKAAELERMGLSLPMGVGIAGFCAQEAVSLAISETEMDPRFHREVSEALGYPVRSILCAPMVSGGRTFGCVEVINRRESSTFTDAELAILSYVAHQGARFLELR